MDNQAFEIGNTVEHKQFGIGRIEQVHRGTFTKYWVRFPTVAIWCIAGELKAVTPQE